MTIFPGKDEATCHHKSHSETVGGVVAISATLNVPVIFACPTPEEMQTGFVPLAGHRIFTVGSPNFSFYMFVSAASAVARLELLGSEAPTFLVEKWVAIIPATAVAQLSSNQRSLLAIRSDVAGTLTAAGAGTFTSPFPYNRWRFVNGATAQLATFTLTVRGGHCL